MSYSYVNSIGTPPTKYLPPPSHFPGPTAPHEISQRKKTFEANCFVPRHEGRSNGIVVYMDMKVLLLKYLRIVREATE